MGGQDANEVMGPHPMSDSRQQVSQDAAIMNATFKRALALRKMQLWYPSSECAMYTPLERDQAKDFKYNSLVFLKSDRRKHVRTGKGPQDSFTLPPITSHDIGWLQHDDTFKKGDTAWIRKPVHPRGSSAVTKFYDNMKLTNSEAIMRSGR